MVQGGRWGGMGTKNRNFKAQAEIYNLVGVAWKKDEKNDTNIQGISKSRLEKYLDLFFVNLVSSVTINQFKI